MLAENNKIILLKHLEAENAHHMDRTLETLTEDCVFEDKTLGQIYNGRQGARQYYNLWWKAFGVTVQSEKIHYTGRDQCVVEVRFQGVHQGQFLGIPATGRPVDLPLAIFISLENGLLAGERFYWDLTTLLQQMGIEKLPVNLERAVELAS